VTDHLTPREQRTLEVVMLGQPSEMAAIIAGILARFRPQPWEDPLEPEERKALNRWRRGSSESGDVGFCMHALDRLTKKPEETPVEPPAPQPVCRVEMLVGAACHICGLERGHIGPHNGALRPTPPPPAPAWVTEEELRRIECGGHGVWAGVIEALNTLVAQRIQEAVDGMRRPRCGVGGHMLFEDDLHAALGTRGTP
jgi:hypothetical protein